MQGKVKEWPVVEDATRTQVDASLVVQDVVKVEGVELAKAEKDKEQNVKEEKESD